MDYNRSQSLLPFQHIIKIINSDHYKYHNKITRHKKLVKEDLGQQREGPWMSPLGLQQKQTASGLKCVMNNFKLALLNLFSCIIRHQHKHTVRT